jgi:hypothetical protein
MGTNTRYNAIYWIGIVLKTGKVSYVLTHKAIEEIRKPKAMKALYDRATLLNMPLICIN